MRSASWLRFTTTNLSFSCSLSRSVLALFGLKRFPSHSSSFPSALLRGGGHSLSPTMVGRISRWLVAAFCGRCLISCASPSLTTSDTRGQTGKPPVFCPTLPNRLNNKRWLGGWSVARCSWRMCVCLVQMGEEWLLFLTGIAAHPLSLVVEPEKRPLPLVYGLGPSIHDFH